MGDEAPNYEAPKREFWLMPENKTAFELFHRCDTQWNITSGMAGGFKTGLNYPGVKVVMELCYPDDDHIKLFEKLQAAERLALKAFSDKMNER